MNRWHDVIILAAAVFLAAAGIVWGGNREMIERRIQELDRLNRGVVQQVPDLPRDGQVRVRAQVEPDGTARFLETEVIPPPRAAARVPAPAGETVSSLGSALKDRARGEAQMHGFRDDNADGRYTRLRDALAAFFGKRP